MLSKKVKDVALICLVIFIFLFLIKFFNVSYPLTVVTTTKSTELSVVGEGKIEVVPDTASIDLGILVSNVTTVDEVQKKINEINNKIIDAMKNLGIEKNDIKTSNYSIHPQYSYEERQNRIIGYEGNAVVNIKIRDTQLVAKVIEEGTKAGANQVQGVQFLIDKPEKYREDARNQAIENAKKQAQKMAKSLGIKLGKIVNIVEASPDRVPLPYQTMKAEGLGAGVLPQIEPGSQIVTSVVTLYFEKK